MVCSLAPWQVTLLQAVRRPGKPDTFSFQVDGSMQNLTAYITGAPSLTFNLTSSSGAHTPFSITDLISHVSRRRGYCGYVDDPISIG